MGTTAYVDLFNCLRRRVAPPPQTLSKKGATELVTVQPWMLLAIVVAAWVNRRLADAIEYLLEENRNLKQQLGGRRIYASRTTSSGAWP